MKKFLPYLILILLLAGAAAWLILYKTSGNAELKEKAFAIDNAKDVSKITLLDQDKKRIELTKINGVWMVNGKFPARDELVQTLFEAITRVTVLCPVAKAAHDNVLRMMLERNIKVDIYTDNKDQPVKTYYVGGPTPDNQGTYMLLEMDGKPMARPYITYMPNIRGYMTFRYNTNEEDWRSRELFNYNEPDIKALTVEYPGEEEKSFSLHRLVADSFELLPLEEEKHLKTEPYQQKYIRQYLGFYSSIFFEAFDNNFPKRDSTMGTTPYCIISVTGADNAVNKVKLFYMPISRRSKMQFDEKGNEMTYDIDHYHAAVNNDKDFVIVQYYVFGKLMRKYKDFFFKPQQ